MAIGVKGQALAKALEGASYTTNRRNGDNPRGISVRHNSLSKRVLVCHVHVDRATDEVIGFYFNCVTEVACAQRTADLAAVKLEASYHASKRGGIDRYVTSKLQLPVSLEAALALVAQAHERHPWNGRLRTSAP